MLHHAAKCWKYSTLAYTRTYLVPSQTLHAARSFHCTVRRKIFFTFLYYYFILYHLYFIFYSILFILYYFILYTFLFYLFIFATVIKHDFCVSHVYWCSFALGLLVSIDIVYEYDSLATTCWPGYIVNSILSLSILSIAIPIKASSRIVISNFHDYLIFLNNTILIVFPSAFLIAQSP